MNVPLLILRSVARVYVRNALDPDELNPAGRTVSHHSASPRVVQENCRDLPHKTVFSLQDARHTQTIIIWKVSAQSVGALVIPRVWINAHVAQLKAVTM